MTRLILSTGNLISAGPSVFRSRLNEKSNVEFLNSLRANIEAAQDSAIYNLFGSATADGNGNGYNDGHSNGAHSSPTRASLKPSDWTENNSSGLMIPAIDWEAAVLTEDRSQYDSTIKLFLLDKIPQDVAAAQVNEALNLVRRELGVEDVDLLIVSFPYITFKEFDPSPSEARVQELSKVQPLMKAAWPALEKLHEAGSIKSLGVSEFDSITLKQFLALTHTKPSVDQINIQDCCSVPELQDYSKSQCIRLLTHTDCTDILPTGTLRELLGHSEGGFGVLADPADPTSEGLKGDVEPWFVVKYTAIVRNRGVIESKGYFAVADLKS